MPSWNDLGNVLNTLREIDVNTIREESERPLQIACVSEAALFETLTHMLHQSGSRHYGPVGLDPLLHFDLFLGLPLADLRRADMLLLLADGRQPLSALVIDAKQQLENLLLPLLIVVLHAETFVAPAGWSTAPHCRVITIANPDTPVAADTLATALLDRLPSELHLAAARRLPGLRPIVARNLINSTSFTNASYSLASGLPEQIPILSIPFAAADILVLTKNQALMVYKLALAHGAAPEFYSRMREMVPVVGGAYIWRQMARSLVGLIPMWGLVPKIAIAYAGTYTTGVAAWRWYASGELVSADQLKRISQEAMRQGRAWAQQLIAQARGHSEATPGRIRQFFGRLLRALPGRRPKPELKAPPDGGATLD